MAVVRGKQQRTRDQVLASEAKVAKGVQLLHENFIQGKTLTYDAQGIASIVITPEQIKAITGKIKIIEEKIRLIENGISLLEEELKVLEEEIKQAQSETLEKNAQRTAIEKAIKQKKMEETPRLKKEINALKAQFPIDQF